MVQHEKFSLRRLAGIVALAVAGSACVQAVPPLPLPNSLEQSTTDSVPARQANATPAANAGGNSSAAARATPVAQPTAVASSALARRTVAVRRAAMADEVLLSGRVVGQGDTPLSFGIPVRLTSLSAKVGQQVEQDAILGQGDTAILERDLKAIRERLDANALKLAQAQTQVEFRRQGAVADAEDRLAKAQADLSKVQAGPGVAERTVAEGAVVSAQAALAKVQSEQAKLQAGATPTELRAAEQKVAAAQLAVRKAETDYAALLKIDPNAVRAAELDVANAQTALDTAQAELVRLTRGADPLALRQADRNVATAQAALRAAQDGEYKVDSARAAAVAGAQAALDTAKDALAKLKEPPTQPQLDAARNKVDGARFALTSAQAKLETLRQGTTQLTLEAAKAAADSARASFDDAQVQQQVLQRGATEDQLANAQAAVDGAMLALQGAQARLEDINGKPTRDELQEAQARVVAAQRALAAARAGDGVGEISTLQQLLATDRQQQALLQAQLDASTLRAPFKGVVSQVLAQNGDLVEPGKLVAVLSRPAPPLVQATVGPRQKNAPDVAAGQRATLQLDGETTKLTGAVAMVEDNATGTARVATLQVEWGPSAPSFGTFAQVWVVVQDKPNVLVVPQRAVRASGDKRFVDILGGVDVKAVEVLTGLSNGTDMEILSGLAEGQEILLSDAAVTSVPNAAVQTARPQAANPPPDGPRVLLNGDFANPAGGWPNDLRGPTRPTDGGYRLTTLQPGRFVAVRAPLPRPVQDVTVRARFRKLAGPLGGGYGLIVADQTPGTLDGVQQAGRFIVLEVGDKGEFGVWQRDGERWVELVPWTPAPTAAVRTGTAANDLEARGVGGRLEFVANGVPLATLTPDGARGGGYVGVFAGGDGNDVLLEQLLIEEPEAGARL